MCTDRVFGDEIEQNPAVHCGLIVSHQCLLRNKRCLLAYLYVLCALHRLLSAHLRPPLTD